MNKDLFDLESFDASLSRFRAKIKEANEAEKADPGQSTADDESDEPSYADLDETTAATGKALKKVIPL